MPTYASNQTPNHASNRKLYLVKELAELSGVSVRTLHHYDEIGLLVPKKRSQAGYRLYTRRDLLRLQQILLQRELGFSLEEIRRSLDDPQFDQRQALRMQRAELVKRRENTEAMIRAVDAALEELDMSNSNTSNTGNTGKNMFDGFDPQKYEAEAEQRWGETDSYKISMERTKKYSKADWDTLKAEQDQIYRDAYALLQAGTPADSDAAMQVAERHRLSMDRWFYPCSHAMQVNLSEMWIADARFQANIDKYGAGLTEYLAAAVCANAARVDAARTDTAKP